MASTWIGIDESTSVEKRVDAESVVFGTTEVMRQRMQIAGASSGEIAPVSSADGILVNLGANNDVTISGGQSSALISTVSAIRIDSTAALLVTGTSNVVISGNSSAIISTVSAIRIESTAVLSVTGTSNVSGSTVVMTTASTVAVVQGAGLTTAASSLAWLTRIVDIDSTVGVQVNSSGELLVAGAGTSGGTQGAGLAAAASSQAWRMRLHDAATTQGAVVNSSGELLVAASLSGSTDVTAKQGNAGPESSAWFFRLTDGTAPVVISSGTVASSARGLTVRRPTATLSAGNASTVALTSGAAFTGTFEDVSDYGGIIVSLFADQPSHGTSGVTFEWSQDGSSVHNDANSSLSANDGRSYSLSPRARFFRVRYLNTTAAAQTVFRLQTMYFQEDPGHFTRPIATNIDNTYYAQLTRSIIAGMQQGGGSSDYLNVTVTPSAKLRVEANLEAGSTVSISTASRIQVEPGPGATFPISGNSTVALAAGSTMTVSFTAGSSAAVSIQGGQSTALISTVSAIRIESTAALAVTGTSNVTIAGGQSTALISTASIIRLDSTTYTVTGTSNVSGSSIIVGNITAPRSSGISTAVGQAVSLNVGGYGAAAIQITGDVTGASFSFQGTVDSSAWKPIRVKRSSGSSLISSLGASTGMFLGPSGGLTAIRVLLDSTGVGTSAHITLQAGVSAPDNNVQVKQGLSEINLDQGWPVTQTIFGSTLTIGNIAKDANRVFAGTTAITVQRAFINVTSSAPATVISSAANARIRVLGWNAVAASTTVLTWFNDSTAGTTLAGPYNLAANGGLVVPVSEYGWFETSSGVDLVLKNSEAVQVGVNLIYIQSTSI